MKYDHLIHIGIRTSDTCKDKPEEVTTAVGLICNYDWISYVVIKVLIISPDN